LDLDSDLAPKRQLKANARGAKKTEREKMEEIEGFNETCSDS
jgi:hypothetical protein